MSSGRAGLRLTRASVRAERLADSRGALPALFLLSLLETIVLPVPIETVIVPWMLMQPRRLWVIATVTLAGCLAGALVGYAVGMFLFETVGQWLLGAHGHTGAHDRFVAQFDRYGFWAILAVGLLPIPFQAAMLAAGVAGFPLSLFLLAATLARGMRYYGLALLVRMLGPLAFTLWRRHRRAVWVGVTLLIVISAVVVHLVSGF